MPHHHPEDRVYTVISGVFYVGLGSRFDEEQLQAYPPDECGHVLPVRHPAFPLGEVGGYAKGYLCDRSIDPSLSRDGLDAPTELARVRRRRRR